MPVEKRDRTIGVDWKLLTYLVKKNSMVHSFFDTSSEILGSICVMQADGKVAVYCIRPHKFIIPKNKNFYWKVGIKAHE